ncbi:MAG TPA: phospho-N-acetylmuramoyl-pentapeptide-transferase [Acidimicrobiia bacterium]|jgi:phospho-N-acetylmuramoyl-pentapeptide-transferase|nr:phospho-N-acetylmuramoyl-pentapeptide-transferase [Acidimicrobiia bacterium]
MIAMLMAAGAAFVVTVFFTPLLIRRLRVLGIGQQIRDDGPIEHPHAAKAGTPTMGGIAIVLATVVGYLFAHVRRESIKFATPGLALIALVIGLGVVGWIDDYLGVRAGRNLGLRKRGKTLGIVVVAGAFAWLAVYFVHTDTHLSFTQPLDIDLGKVGLFVWAILVVYATANAVNLTDGLDGLATGSSALTFMAFMIIAFTEFRHEKIYGVLPAQALDQAVVAAAMFGACAGFLWWNAAPARIFMGDTGSLAIGGAMGGLALLTRTHLLLPLLAGLPAIETLSVIAQIVSYRGFRKRVLRMAPIHHHFEVGGWSEFTVIVRFWLFAGICVALAVGIFYADFLRHGVNLG